MVVMMLQQSTTGIQRPLSTEELQALQGLAPTFDAPPKGWQTPNADRVQDQEFDYNGIGMYAAAVGFVELIFTHNSFFFTYFVTFLYMNRALTLKS